MAFGKTSKARLATVDPALQNIMNQAIAEYAAFPDYDFGIAQGIRTLEQQRQYIKDGKSKTRNSRHLHGYAVDIFRWDKRKKKAMWGVDEIRPIAKVIREIADANGTPLVWGGDWPHFKDAPHFQLDYAQFPDKKYILEEIARFDWDA